MHTSEDYRNMAKYHTGRADALDGLLKLLGEDLSGRVRDWVIQERRDQRQEAINCYDVAIRLLKEGE